jgi:hypothetical protein
VSVPYADSWPLSRNIAFQGNLLVFGHCWNYSNVVVIVCAALNELLNGGILSELIPYIHSSYGHLQERVFYEEEF